MSIVSLFSINHISYYSERTCLKTVILSSMVDEPFYHTITHAIHHFSPYSTHRLHPSSSPVVFTVRLHAPSTLFLYSLLLFLLKLHSCPQIDWSHTHLKCISRVTKNVFPFTRTWLKCEKCITTFDSSQRVISQELLAVSPKLPPMAWKYSLFFVVAIWRRFWSSRELFNKSQPRTWEMKPISWSFRLIQSVQCSYLFAVKIIWTSYATYT